MPQTLFATLLTGAFLSRSLHKTISRRFADSKTGASTVRVLKAHIGLDIPQPSNFSTGPIITLLKGGGWWISQGLGGICRHALSRIREVAEVNGGLSRGL